MPQQISVRTYLIICSTLISLTVVTTAISFLHLSSSWHLALGLFIAACKAMLVVLFFMHAILSDQVVRAVILIAGFWLGILLVLGLSDYVTRGLVPFIPGH